LCPAILTLNVVKVNQFELAALLERTGKVPELAVNLGNDRALE
jgi:hypothetical protein